MPMPDKVAKEKINARLNSAKTVADKIRIINEEIEWFPDFSTYHKLKKELLAKRELYLKHETKTKKHSKLEIRKQGIGTICLIAFPNAGKSTLMKKITNADPEVAAYAFTTKQPYSGMLQVEGFQIQIIEIPGIMENAADGYGKGREFLGVARNADAIVLLAALDDKPLEKLDILKKELEKSNIRKPILEIGTKSDIAEPVPGMFCISENQNLEPLKERLFQMLGKIRVCTKKPRQEADLANPIVLKKNSTVADLAEKLELPVSCALLWGSAKFPGQTVSKEHILQDRDVIELHP